jgi:hypothetical protein
MARERRWPDLKTSLENIEKGIIDCSSDAFPPYDLEDWEILGELAPDQTAADSFAQFADGSPAYQAILDEGRAQEAKRIVLLLGSQRFGPPSAPLRAALEAVSDLSQIEDVARRLLDAPSWDKLLDGQASRR